MSTTPTGPEPEDVDERFRRIIDAEFGSPSPAPQPGPFDLAHALDEAVPDPPDEPFVAPDPGPPPLPRGRALAGAGLLVGALAVMLAGLFGATVTRAVGTVAVVAFVLGLALLLACLPRQPRDPDDDGARV